MSYIWQVYTVFPHGVPPGDTCEIRNVNETGIVNSGNMVAEVGLSRDASVISGTLTLFGYSERISGYNTHYFAPWGVVRNGNCLYYHKATAAIDTAHGVVIAEVNLLTEVETLLTVYTLSVGAFAPSAQISFIADRKVLVYCPNDLGTSTIFIVDFDASTSVATTTHDYPIYIRTLKKLNGDVWLYVLCSSSGVYEIKYKNFTQNTAWATISIDPGGDDGIANTPIFIGEDYMVWFLAYSSTPPQAKCVVWNLNTNDIGMTNAINGPGDDDHWYINYSAPDLTTGKAYAVAWGYHSPYAGAYGSFDYWLEVDPVTLVLSVIHTQEDYHAAILITRLYSTNTKAYFVQAVTMYIYEASTMTYLGTISALIGSDTKRSTNLMDDAGRFWWYDNAGNLKSAGLDGAVQDTISVSGILLTGNAIHVYHSASSIVLVCRQTVSPNGYYRFYLVT